MFSLRSLLVLALIIAFAVVFGDVAYGQTCSASVDKTVMICSPANGASLPSPVQFTAAARDNEHPITGMVLYVDSVIQARSTNGLLSASVSLAAGKHAIVIRAWDTTGFFFSSSESITVTTAVAPTVTIRANPAQISSGQSSTITVTAQNASQVVVTNNVDSTSQQLSSTGGTFSVSPSQTTTYAATATA
ncbi:MAG TPA: hypothetical protein VI685_22365, partial [Candidatus Angelobacter sp.]